MVVVTRVYQQRVFEAQNSEKKKEKVWSLHCRQLICCAGNVIEAFTEIC